MKDEDAAMVKLFCSEMVNKVADETVQIYGGMGLMEEMPIQRLWRDSRLKEFGMEHPKFKGILFLDQFSDPLGHERNKI